MRGSKVISAVLLLCFMIVFNLSAASDYAFGTKVITSESDLGRLLKNVPDSTIIGYWDIGPNVGIYDGGDVVYLDMPPIGYANSNDIRLTPLGNWPAGTKVTPNDNDVDSPLKPLNAEIRFLNLNGSQSYDLDDPVYVHQSSFFGQGDAPGAISASDPVKSFAATGELNASPANAANIAAINATVPEGSPKINNQNADYSTYNSSSADASTDNAPATSAPILGAQTANNWSAEESSSSAENDAYAIEGFWERLSYVGYCDSLPRGTLCLIYSDNFIWPVSDYCIDITPYLVGFDNDGRPIEGIRCDSADYYHILGTLFVKSVSRQKTLFVQSSSAPEDLIRTNDIRLTSVGGMAAGTRAGNFEPDLNKLVALPLLVSFPRRPDDYGCIRVYDANGNGLYDSPDDVYLDISFPGYSTFGTVSINDVRLSV